MIGSSGYDILERSHITSRLWTPLPILGGAGRGASSSSSLSSLSNSYIALAEDGSVSIQQQQQQQQLHPKLFTSRQHPKQQQKQQQKQHQRHNDPMVLSKDRHSTTTGTSSSSTSTSSTGTSDSTNDLIQEDTTPSKPSFVMPTNNDSLTRISSWITSTTTKKPWCSSKRKSSSTFVRPTTSNNGNIMIGSAGCSVDCEVLKRTIRSDIRSALYFGELSLSDGITPLQMAILLSQILYSRRGFPYYSFCIVAGCDMTTTTQKEHNNIPKQLGEGQVFIFDAIGSYEQVAATCTGTGREMMQPILDRKFRSPRSVRQQHQQQQGKEPFLVSERRSTTSNDIFSNDDECSSETISQDTSTATTTTESSSIMEQNRFVSERSTIVDCDSVEEVISILLDAYRAVSEREISVGDQIVFYTMQTLTDDDTSTTIAISEQDTVATKLQCNIYTSPLKKH